MNNSPTMTSTTLGLAVTAGNLAVWLGLLTAVLCVVFYWGAMLRSMPERSNKTLPRLLGAILGGTVATMLVVFLLPVSATIKLAVVSAVIAVVVWSAARLPIPVKETADAVGGNGKRRAGGPANASAEAAERWLRNGRRMFYLNGVFVVIAAIALYTLIFGREYTVLFIHKNTNNALPFGYRFASFWSDQQGTFILWGFLNLILGSALIRKAADDERWVMPFFTLTNVSLFTLLTLMNPYWLISPSDTRQLVETFGQQNGISSAQIEDVLKFLPSSTMEHVRYYMGWGEYLRAIDGRGLNEQLQNFWMVIHPPTLFVGYASMMVPACFALAALMRRDYDGWVNRAAPWLMFAWTVLGLGIFLGGYWAYETLGWGGYWAWDPVENASLIPWLVATALLHGLLAQRNRGNYKQANLFFGLMAGTTVLLGSFLVRSGVLDGISVHSFATPQKSVFITLLAVLTLWFMLTIGVWMWRFKDIQSEIAYEQTWERHFGFFLGLIVLSASSIIVTFGVTLPIWKPWLPLTGGSSTVDFTFYNKALLPIAFVMVLLMGITPLMPWRRSQKPGEAPRPIKTENVIALWAGGAITLFFIGAAIWAYLGGFQTQNDPAYVAVGLVVLYALTTNLICLKRSIRGGFLNAGPWFTHIGFIVMLAGVVISSRFNETRLVEALAKGETAVAFGREFTFQGLKKAENAADRDRMLIDMKTPDGKVRKLAPKFFVTEQSGEPQPMAWPEIIPQGLHDIYISPSGFSPTGGMSVSKVEKGKTGRATLQHTPDSPQDTIDVTLLDFDNSEVQMENPDPNAEPTLWADVLLNVNGVEKKTRVGLRVTTNRGLQPVPALIEGLNQSTPYFIQFQLNTEDMSASFDLVPAEPNPQAFFQVLWVPGIQVLWWGVYVMVFGGALCYLRRRKLAQRPVGGAPQPAGAELPERTPRASKAEPVGAALSKTGKPAEGQQPATS